MELSDGAKTVLTVAVEEIRAEEAARMAYLKSAKTALEKAAYPEVFSDHHDIYNCGIEKAVGIVNELIEASE